VFGKPVQTDGVALKVQRLFVEAKPEHIAVPRIPASQYLNKNHDSKAVRETKAQFAITIATDNAAVLAQAEPPPLPPEGNVEDPEFLKDALGLTVTRADATATKWRKLAKLCKPEEAQRCTEAAQGWTDVSAVLLKRREADRA
jgi:hypothetical protein